MGILKVQNLSYSVGPKVILDDVSIDFWRGSIHAIVGPNGAGKSTLASVIMGLSDYRKFDGDLFFEGESIRDKSIFERARLGITYAWQEPARFEGLRICDFIAASAKEPSIKVVEDALKLVGLDPEKYMDRAVDKTLSGGERKRVELASIVVMQPRVVLMDEPDSGIDVAALTKIFEVLKVLKAQGCTVILITHSLEVLKQAEHIFLMCQGKITAKGTTPDMYEYFANKCIPCEHKNTPDEEDLNV